jgi:hypothetical protein
MRAWLLVLASCSPAATPTPRPHASHTPTFATWQTLATPLDVIVIDDYKTAASCDGVAPHRLAVSLDGKPLATIDIACSTTVHAPPRQLAAPRVDVPPGKHHVDVRDLATGVTGAADLELPVIEPPYGAADDDIAHVLATKLPIWANEDELDVQGLRASMQTL